MDRSVLTKNGPFLFADAVELSKCLRCRHANRLYNGFMSCWEALRVGECLISRGYKLLSSNLEGRMYHIMEIWYIPEFLNIKGTPHICGYEVNSLLVINNSWY